MRPVLRFSRSPARALGLTPLLLGVLLTGLSEQGCAPRHTSSEPLIGITRAGEEPEDEQGMQGAAGAPSTEEEAPAPRDPIAEEQERELSLARHALSGAEADPHFQVAFAVVERASDLPWILAIENRAEQPVELAADPSLLRLEVTPPDAPEPDATTVKSKTSAKTNAPHRCGGEALPKTSNAERRLTLEPGGVLTYAFDPRQLCEDAGVLKEGASIRVSYGWPVETKKVWSGGKANEVELEARAPFVARRPGPEPTTPRSPAPPKNDEIPPAGLKELKSTAFVLGETYPLDSVTLFPEAAGESSASTASAEAAPETSEEEASSEATSDGGDPRTARASAPPPPLSLTVKPLGKTKSPEETTVTVTVKNQSSKGVSLFLRRELLVYEVLGPQGATTCRMHPQVRAPDSASFDALGAGSSRSLITRLAEACPPSTFAEAGTYSVSARLEARERGREYGLDAFVGDVRSKEPARFEVTGTKPRPIPPQFRIAPRTTGTPGSAGSEAPAANTEDAPSPAPEGAGAESATPAEP